MTKETGGPAFPVVQWETDDDGNLRPRQTNGMTLRDYFAANAPKSNEQWERDYCRRRGYMSEAKMIADWNYEYADEMMKAREQ